MTIRFRLFGTLELRNGNGTDLHSVLAHTKHTALLAYIGVNGSALHRRERLAALFWPDLDDARSRNALSKALHHLRRALGDDLFAAGNTETVGGNPDRLWCDVAAFEGAARAGQHREALDLYGRGELLEGFSLSDATGFEHWLDRERLRLRRVASASAAALTDEAERLGDLAAAAQCARTMCELFPYDEAALRRRVELMVRAGNRAEAIHEYRSFAERISRELEAEPTAETRALVAMLQAEGPVTTAPAIPEATPFSEARPASAPAPPAAPDEAPLRQAIPEVRSHTRRVAAYTAYAALAAAAVVVGFFVLRPREQARAVAVSALRNRTGNPMVGALADIATGDIVKQITQSGAVEVVDLRGSSAAHSSGSDSTSANARALARAAGASTLVRGDIYTKGDSLLVQMQIVRASDGRVVQQLDPMTAPAHSAYEILDLLRDGVTGAVAALADTLYTPWSTAHSHPPRFAAFQEFMQGLDALVHQGPQPAVDHLAKAVALDTAFVEAKIWLLEQADMLPAARGLLDSIQGAALAQRGRLGAFDQLALDREVAFLAGRWEDVYVTSRRLVALAPRTQDAQVYLAQAAMATRRYHEALATLHAMDRSSGWLKDLSQLWQWDLDAHRLTGDVDGARAEWERLRAQSPADYDVCRAGVLLTAMSGSERAVDALIQECAALTGAPRVRDREWLIAGRGFRNRGYSEAARHAFIRALDARGAVTDRDPRRHAALGQLLCELGRWAPAYEELRAGIDTSSLNDRELLAVAAAHVGDTATVSASLRWIDAWSARERPRGEDDMNRAFIHVALGDHERAIDLLRRAMDAGAAPPWNGWYLRFELEPLRGNTRFDDLVRPRPIQR